MNRTGILMALYLGCRNPVNGSTRFRPSTVALFIQHGKDSLGSICMFGIEGKHLEPIHSVAKKFGPTYNPEKLGAWGILFLCCGAMAGR